MQLKAIIDILETIAPLEIQESYDNCGLLIGSKHCEVSKALLCLDISADVLEEAIHNQCNLIISHHPFIFKSIKKVTDTTLAERIITKAIQNNIAIYAMHTNLDNVLNGSNAILADKIGLVNTAILDPKDNMLRKIVVFCPKAYAEKVREAMFSAGAGHIGNYDSCSFNMEGTGTFKGNDISTPFVGQAGKLHVEPEIRIEMIAPLFLVHSIVKAMLVAHPYEEVAYDVYPIENKFNTVGAGLIGELEQAMTKHDFLQHIKNQLHISSLRFSESNKKQIKRVAVCSGSGSFLITKALSQKVDVFITADLKYHDFQIPDNQMLLVDIGHFESEIFIKDWLFDIFTEKIPTFAVLKSKQEKNPVNYL